MSSSIGTAQDRELIERLANDARNLGFEQARHDPDLRAYTKVEAGKAALAEYVAALKEEITELGDVAKGCAKREAKAVDALQSRIAEGEALCEALDDCVASLAAIRATADNPDEWALSAEHFSTVCLDSLKVARDALSLQRRV